MKCANCQKEFVLAKRYSDHIKNQICRERECTICSKSFATDFLLKRHNETKEHKRRAGIKGKTEIEIAQDELNEALKLAEDRMAKLKSMSKELENKPEPTPQVVVNGNLTINIYNTVQVIVEKSNVPEEIADHIGKKITTAVKFGSDALKAIGDNTKYLCSQINPEIHYFGEDTSIVIRGKDKSITERAIPAIKSALASCIVPNSDPKITEHLDDLKYSLTFPNTTEERKFDNPDRPYLQPPEKVDEAVRKNITIPAIGWNL